MKTLFRPVVIVVALVMTITAGLLVRHTEQGYVQYIEGNLAEAKSLLSERGRQGDALASFIAAGLAGQWVRNPLDVCKSRQLYALSAEQGFPAARALYVATLLQISSSPDSCAWVEESLDMLTGSDNGLAAVMMSILLEQKACGGPAPQQSLIYLLLGRSQGMKAMGDKIDALAALPGTSVEAAEAEARILLEQTRPTVDWSAIHASEPPGFCQGVIPD
tara:strand:+ start:1917 stop:2573 length:657 start_codon:yes stop_codon:yes gene_type:complete